MKIIKKCGMHILAIVLLLCITSIPVKAADFETEDRASVEVGITFTEESSSGEETPTPTPDPNPNEETPQGTDGDEQKPGTLPSTGERKLIVSMYIGITILLFVLVGLILKNKVKDKRNE